MLRKIKGHLAVLGAGICFSLIGVFAKSVGTDVPIITISFLRLFLGVCFLGMVIPLIDKKALHPKKDDLKHYALIGFFIAINLTLWTSSFLFAPVSTVNLVGTLYVVFTFFFASLILKEKITSRMFIAMLVGFIGLAVLNPFNGGYGFGNSLALSSSAIFGLILVLMRREERTHSIGITFWFLLFASLFLLPFALYFGFGDWQQSILPLLGIGLLSTGLAYLLLDYGLKRVSAGISSLLLMLSTPIFAIFFATTLLGEMLSIHIVLGGILLIAAGLILELHIKSAKHHVRH